MKSHVQLQLDTFICLKMLSRVAVHYLTGGTFLPKGDSLGNFEAL